MGLGLAGVGAGAAYKAAPSFWKQAVSEIGREVAPAPRRLSARRWPETGLALGWLGHATVLIKIDGFTILTDPVFSQRVGLGLGPVTLGLKRLVAPAAAVGELPRIDLVLLSHAHMDHFDLPSLEALQSMKTQVLTARGTTDLLEVDKWARVSEIGWGERVKAGPLEIEGLRVKHWGARMRTDHWRGYNGYAIRSGRWRVVFAGDTAWTEEFKQVGGTNVAIMPIGAYDPWIRNHCSPEQAWTMANQAKADYVMPVHHATFQLSREPMGEPMERLLGAAGSRVERVAVRRIGEEFRLG